MPAVYRGCRREGNKRAFSLGGTTLQGQYFGLSIPEVYKAVCIGCKSFESWHSNAWISPFKCLWIAIMMILNMTTTRAVQPVATCRQSPYLHKAAIVIVTSFSLWRYSRPARPVPASHGHAVRLIMTSFSLWRHWHHAHPYGRTNERTNERTDTLPRLIYKDVLVTITSNTLFTILYLCVLQRLLQAWIITRVVATWVLERAETQMFALGVTKPQFAADSLTDNIWQTVMLVFHKLMISLKCFRGLWLGLCFLW